MKYSPILISMLLNTYITYIIKNTCNTTFAADVNRAQNNVCNITQINTQILGLGTALTVDNAIINLFLSESEIYEVLHINFIFYYLYQMSEK